MPMHDKTKGKTPEELMKLKQTAAQRSAKVSLGRTMRRTITMPSEGKKCPNCGGKEVDEYYGQGLYRCRRCAAWFHGGHEEKVSK